MDEDILAVDLSAMHWRKWFAKKSQVEVFQHVTDKVDFLARVYPNVVICSDSFTNFRHELTADLEKGSQYKSKRPKKDPEGLLTLHAEKAWFLEQGYPLIECDGYEADDVIATVVAQAKGRCVHILSEDKDLYQLISDTTTQITYRGHMGPDECVRKFGVRPDQMRDLLVITGDDSDNIAGCPGVGIDKVPRLFETFGDIDGIKRASVDELKSIDGIGNATSASIVNWDPELAVKLVTLATDCPFVLDEILDGYESRVESHEITFGDSAA